MEHRFASDKDLPLLAKWNYQLIRDEGHRNPMTEAELLDRMRGWLNGVFQTVVFEENGKPVAYSLFRENETEVHLRQMFVDRNFRRRGIGREAIEILRTGYWPAEKRILVEVLTKNTAGKAFWRSVGFQDYSLALEILP